jgi:ArsR family transcriptional regulator, arsenate/arsenite/antimonite-responsive transcriptional repressor / arsenate reductase (thioredoxin)
MDTDRHAETERRAALHGALADAGRLAVVDLLTLGDASPSEIAAQLEMPSNLLAHHVNVLVEHGVVERVRSEGDRRRTYLRLVGETLEPVAHAEVPRPERVLFVCTANSARSHLAAALWRRASTVPAESAGTHPADQINPGALAVASRHDLTLPHVRPQHLDEVRRDDDLVVTVCDRAHEECGAQADLHWSVPDPVRVGTDEAFDTAVLQLGHRVDGLARRLAHA